VPRAEFFPAPRLQTQTQTNNSRRWPSVPCFLRMASALAPALLEGWSWLRFACSAPHSPSLDPFKEEGVAGAIAKDSRPFTSASRSLAAETPDAIYKTYNLTAYRITPRTKRYRSFQPPACFPILRSPDKAEFPIHMEPSNNIKHAAPGQAAYREKSSWPSRSFPQRCLDCPESQQQLAPRQPELSVQSLSSPRTPSHTASNLSCVSTSKIHRSFASCVRSFYTGD
jgi:hypothetical protein